MPPSPALRCSPGRDHRMENTHRRGRSFESGLMLKAKDDDLALFNEMQNRERENFLLHSTDDVDDSISKLRYFSDFKLNINIPARGESSDLLNADGEKNDYDWLLTPPDTPLFPSLDDDDDDEPQSVNLAPRGRPRSQPISISRSAMGEKVHRTGRNSASPHQLSPSPRSSYSAVQSRIRPFSAPRSSPPPVLRPTTPSRRAITPPTKPSKPTPRSSTPTLQRMSTGSSGQVFSSGARGTSPVKASRGNSASPKFRGWQSNLPGFSSDAPPNLRTSLSDRSTSRVRGLSPASGNGRDLSSKFRRQSISPSSSSRSASLSLSHERDRLSSYSKASSAEDDVESMHSVSVGTYGSSMARKNGALMNSRAMAFSKKPSRMPSANSAPKRSFDSALRQMDHRKTPQNMFRPLLSSVPTTTFYVGKANSLHRPMFSRNSSLTTSSNASSEHGASVAPDMEDSDHEQSDLAGDWGKTQQPDTQEEVFIFDKVDELNEDAGHSIDAHKLQSSNECSDEGMADKNFEEAMTDKIDSHELENSISNVGDASSIAAASQTSNAANEHSEVGSHGMTAICSKCGKHFHVMEADGDMDVCEECAAKNRLLASVELGANVRVTHDEMVEPSISIGKDRLCGEVQLQTGVLKLSERKGGEVMVSQHGRSSGQEQPDFLEDGSPFQLAKDQEELNISQQQMDSQSEVSIPEFDNRNKSQQSQLTSHPSLRFDCPEGTGISVLLLQRSNSSKWPVVQGRSLSATNILCSEPSYARDHMSMSVMRRSIGRDGASVSSSVDLGSSKYTDICVQRQLSSRKGEIDNVRSDCNSSTRSIGSHSEILINATEAPVLAKSETVADFESFVGGTENEAQQQQFSATELHNSFKGTEASTMEHASVGQAIVDGDASVYADSCMASNASDSQSLSHLLSINLHEAFLADNLNDEECTSSNKADEAFCENNERNIRDAAIIATPDCSTSAEDHMLIDTGCRVDISDAATHSSSIVVIGEQNDHYNSQDSQTECTPSQISGNMEDIHEGRISTTSDKDAFISATQSNIAEHHHCIHVMVEGPKKQMVRSLTLEEATDTILFCSSIIHDLAYTAATIGMEKEFVPPEIPRPTVTILGKTVSDLKDSCKISNKRSPYSRKVKRKKVETLTPLPSAELGNSWKKSDCTPPNPEVSNTVDGVKPPKLESKCNCTVM
ncbi:uncharacterized protein [Elaeis guineensis]|uniref:Uncharacterized protein LOC105051371 isoform X2 n=1 Tax=Elaeis guineensis var. tenera TaxID=51953 RepID=A0A6I9RQ12_ELAGV|nr:uncharacterized protein LOC105051371 isoform X2 [Elaeis guineensis]